MMNKILMIASVLILFSCDYREYPQEEEWKEDFLEKQEEEKEREINFTPGNT